MNETSCNCPRCNNKYLKGEIECSNCGIFFQKYFKKRDKEFIDLVSSFEDESFEKIKLKFGRIVKKHPTLKKRCIKFLVALKPAMQSYTSSEYDKSLKLFKDLRLKYPFFQEAERKIIRIHELIEFNEVLNKGVDAFNEDRYSDAKYIFKKLNDKYPLSEKVKLYIDKLSNYIEIEDPEEEKYSSLPSCPKCNSTSISSVKKGYDVSSACCGSILLGPLGLLCGASRSNEIYNVCQKCGHKWLLTK